MSYYNNSKKENWKLSISKMLFTSSKPMLNMSHPMYLSIIQLKMIQLIEDLLSISIMHQLNSEIIWNLRESLRVSTNMERREYSWRLKRTKLLLELVEDTWLLRNSLNNIVTLMPARKSCLVWSTVVNAQVAKSSRLSISLKRLLMEKQVPKEVRD